MSASVSTAVTSAPPRQRKSLPLAAWPEVDRRIWEQACLPEDDLASERGLASGWSPASQQAVQWDYGSWLAYLQGHGLLATIANPASRIMREHVRGFIRAMQDQGNAPLTITGRLGRLIMMAKVLSPLADWSWLMAARSRRLSVAEPKRDKAALIVEADELEQLGLDLMAQAATHDDPDAAACLYRDGLIIALLTRYPLRRKNLLEIKIGQHLQQTSTGWRIKNPVTKSRRPSSIPFPEPLLPHLTTYLTHYRPRLLTMRCSKKAGPAAPTETQRLWINRYGTPVAASSLIKAIALHTEKRFGWTLYPQFFRHCCATYIAEHDPKNIGLGAGVLGHGSFSTTEQNYIVKRGKVALGTYHDIIDATRAAASARQKKGRKR